MILDKIAEKTRERVEKLKQINSPQKVMEQVKAMPAAGGFPFEKALKEGGISFICEVKKASPSKGVIAEDFPYLEIARDYEQAGAAAISVLTEPDFFLGRDEYLEKIAQEVKIPVLRKDFTIDSYQIYEAKIIGASVILLICALLDMDTLRSFLKIADELNLSAIVEAHTETEVNMAVEAGARIIGINNRDLNTFDVDIEVSKRLRQLIPENLLCISESGIKTRGDIEKLQSCHVNGVLIGETLMRSTDKRSQLQKLKGEYDA